MVVSKIFFFHPYLGKIPILTNIFPMRWNHQPEVYGCGYTGFARFMTPKVGTGSFQMKFWWVLGVEKVVFDDFV